MRGNRVQGQPHLHPAPAPPGADTAASFIYCQLVHSFQRPVGPACHPSISLPRRGGRGRAAGLPKTPINGAAVATCRNPRLPHYYRLQSLVAPGAPLCLAPALRPGPR